VSDQGAGAFVDDAGGAGTGRLTRLAYQRLRHMLLTHELPPGAVLTEGPLALRLGMSKTPVRYALRALRNEGILTIGPRRQMQVRDFSAVQRQELDQIRSALERLTVTHACRVMTDADLDDLHAIVRRQRRAADAGREEEFINLDEDFHQLIARRSGLTFAPDLLARVRTFVSVVQATGDEGPARLQPPLEEHRRLLGALERRDEPSALSALADHLTRVAARMEDEGAGRNGRAGPDHFPREASPN
jgi:DNA-binding GntR family transcriptional regulator